MATFGLLGLAICSVWFPPIRFGIQVALPPWPPLFIAAVIAGLVSGYVTWVGAMGLAAFATTAFFARQPLPTRALRAIVGMFAMIAALALAIHALPGFNKAVLIPHIKISSEAPPFTLHASFDQASVGLLLLALLSNRVRSHSEWRLVLLRAFPIAVVTSSSVIGMAVAVGFVGLDLKFSQYAPIFLATNLLFTCVAEEAFFRGFLQERLAGFLSSVRYGSVIAIVCSGLLFGLAHFPGGPTYVALASMAGIGYGYAYASSKRIEAAILAHFSVNAVHFLGFTYPYLQ
jgi:membrane protease YdiL (CAAX protease family)